MGVVRALEDFLGTKILVAQEPQLVGALGAALIALERVRNKDGLRIRNE
jgi:activator of 2-hydroxyglutaryl-CoA dehydratase